VVVDFLYISPKSGVENNRIEFPDSTPESFGFTASDGQCVTPTEAQNATSGSFFTQWTVGRVVRKMPPCADSPLHLF
jgi:hypothetical protein